MTIFTFPFKLSDMSPAAPESWRLSRVYDGLELGDDDINPGYTSGYETRAGLALDAVRRHAPPAGRVLDIAAAQGNFSLQLASEGFLVTWNDLRGELVDYVRLKSPIAEFLTFVAGNAFELDAAHEGAYDIVLATEVIEHTAHPDEFLRQASRLAKPGGAIVLTSPNGQYFRNSLPKFSDAEDPSVFEAVQFKPDADGHIFLIWREELQQFAAMAGLELAEFRHFSNPLTSGHVKLSPLLRMLPGSLVRGLERLTQALPFGLNARINAHWIAVLRRA